MQNYNVWYRLPDGQIKKYDCYSTYSDALYTVMYLEDSGEVDKAWVEHQ